MNQILDLFLPLRSLREIVFLRSRVVCWLLAFGLLPFLITITVLHLELRFEQSIWILGAYFCLFWVFYFYELIAPGKRLIKRGLLYFLFTTVLGIPLLLSWQQFPIIRALYSGIESSSMGVRFLGFVFGVGLLEELCKVLPLLFFSLRRGKLDYQECMFLGAMSGLGFALAEVVQYSINYAQETARLSALMVAEAAGQSRTFFGNINTEQFASKMQETIPEMIENHGTILTVQIVRFIPLPLLHALWTGTVGWFIATSTRSKGIIPWFTVGVGILLAALIHGSYDLFSARLLSVAFAALSILVFFAYLSNGTVAETFSNDNSNAEVVILRCQKCGQKLKAPKHDVEILVTCPSCRYQFTMTPNL